MNDSHATLAPLLSAYLDGELDPARHRLVADHLATCALCTRELSLLRAGDDVLAALQPTPVAPDLRPQLRRRLRRQGARSVLSGGLIALIVLLLRSLAADLAVMKRTDLPRWGRLGIVCSHVLLAAPAVALCVELVRDVRTLVEYAWLSDEPSESGGSDP